MNYPELIEQVIEAHGGRQRWQTVESIEASFSSGGLAFSLHMQPFALRGLQVSIQPHAPRVLLRGYGQPDWCGIWTPLRVQILDAHGSVVAERVNPRAAFSRIDKILRWDKLDVLYFAGYALWNYLSFPFILELPGVSIVESARAHGSESNRLAAGFDDSVPTHSRFQTFHIDDSGLLTRHDYTADVIGRWAKAANFCQASEQVEGLRFYTRRHVLPRFGRTILPFPTLVWIEIDDIRLVRL